jgi:site-specific DNA recombinase
MFAAVYARKSTSQDGVADESKSVTRQVEHAKTYASKNGWTVLADHVYTDDAISGTEFANRPGYMRLLAALKPHPGFDILIISELSRLGREQIETSYAAKQLSQAGVKIFSYLEDREVLLDTPTDKFLLSAMNFAAEIERDKARQRVTDAMMRKARAGHCCGGVLFGYDNVPVVGADGKRSHVERRVNEAEAEIVRRVFTLCAHGKGVKGIAKLLNEGGVASPRPKRNRPRGWAPSSVRAVLHNDLYRGINTWNKRRQSDKWGQRACKVRPEQEWIRADVPHLCIVDSDLWDSARRRLQNAAQIYLRFNRGHLGGRPPSDLASKYLLSGLQQSARCGASMTVRTSSHRRQFYYVCASYDHRGRSVCANAMRLPLHAADEAVLSKVSSYVLDPEIIEGAITDAVAELRPTRDTLDGKRACLVADLGRLDEIDRRLVAGIAAAGQLDALVNALKENEQQRARLRHELKALDGLAQLSTFDARTIERDLRARVNEWRALMGRQTPLARQILVKLLDGRIVWTPNVEAGEYRFSGRAKFDKILAGIVLTRGVVPVRGFEPRSRG